MDNGLVENYVVGDLIELLANIQIIYASKIIGYSIEEE